MNERAPLAMRLPCSLNISKKLPSRGSSLPNNIVWISVDDVGTHRGASAVMQRLRAAASRADCRRRAQRLSRTAEGVDALDQVLQVARLAQRIEAIDVDHQQRQPGM